MGQRALNAPVLCVVGARPNFMKMAPIVRAFTRAVPHVPYLLVHTGQHYDTAMSDGIFQELALPAPHVNLEVGSASHAVQTAEVMRRFEPVLDEHQPACVLVVGDVNSTLACTLVAVKKGVPVVHVEAGLRSFDRNMPEEINRVVTDQIADRLYTTERAAHDHLKAEGIADERIVFAGNVMIDSVLAHRARATPPVETLRRAGIDPAQIAGGEGYAVLTLHRPSNVDDPGMLRSLIATLSEVARKIPIVFAVHPRTGGALTRAGLTDHLAASGFVLLPPQGYLEMLGLMIDARMVLTDSGGIQEETTALGVPCVTLRENTERPVTVDSGTNTVVGRDRATILRVCDEILDGGGKRGHVPEGWDGHAADRIANDLVRWLGTRKIMASAA